MLDEALGRLGEAKNRKSAPNARNTRLKQKSPTPEMLEGVGDWSGEAGRKWLS
jgi:hypothetical protein